MTFDNSQILAYLPMLILIGILILLPLAGAQFGLNLDVISAILRTATGYVLRLLLFLTGNA